MTESSRSWIGIVLGCVCAVIVACGGAAKKSAMPQSTGAAPPGMEAAPSSRRSQIDDLAAQITSDLAKLNLAPQPADPNACITPPCGPETMSSPAAPMSDATCKPGPSQTCKDSCMLADSICTNAGKICTIAQELGGNDAYANEKCGSGNASCRAARDRCCGCQL
ncbi:MAG TPA: hypothetical protein VFQ53_11915 [Kofleriaceae bacterium]|nr:hypothetical protein [Kofleriaceae bacterium]